jgi:Family of unknown function (DUF6599)
LTRESHSESRARVEGRAAGVFDGVSSSSRERKCPRFLPLQLRRHLSSAAALLALLVLAVIPAAAQSILPSSFAGWSQTNNAAFTPPPDGSAAAQEYGFTSGAEASYASGSNHLDVTLYRMKDPSGAYGEYSYLRTQDMLHGKLAEYSAISEDRALVLDGNLLLEIHGRDLPKLDSSLKSLVAAIAPHAEHGALPILMTNLPLKNLVPRTDRYILGPSVLNQSFPVAIGNALGFSNGAEAEVATYRAGAKKMTLLLVDYPTPQFALAKLKQLQQQFDVNDSKRNGGLPPLYATRALTSLALVAGANSEAEANAVLKNVRSGEVLTWNEPTFRFTQPSIGAMVVGTIVGSGIICLFALISGLAFGGVRLVVKRALPDKVFDRSDQLQILQLGLSSKPIKAEDFYGLG